MPRKTNSEPCLPHTAKPTLKKDCLTSYAVKKTFSKPKNSMSDLQMADELDSLKNSDTVCSSSTWNSDSEDLGFSLSSPPPFALFESVFAGESNHINTSNASTVASSPTRSINTGQLCCMRSVGDRLQHLPGPEYDRNLKRIVCIFPYKPKSTHFPASLQTSPSHHDDSRHDVTYTKANYRKTYPTSWTMSSPCPSAYLFCHPPHHSDVNAHGYGAQSTSAVPSSWGKLEGTRGDLLKKVAQVAVGSTGSSMCSDDADAYSNCDMSYLLTF